MTTLITLPNDIYEHIFKYTSAKDFKEVYTSCKSLMWMASDETLWKLLFVTIIPKRFQLNESCDRFMLRMHAALCTLRHIEYFIRVEFMKFLFSDNVIISHRFRCTYGELQRHFFECTGKYKRLPNTLCYDNCESYLNCGKDYINLEKLKKYCNCINVLYKTRLHYTWTNNEFYIISGLKPAYKKVA